MLGARMLLAAVVFIGLPAKGAAIDCALIAAGIAAELPEGAIHAVTDMETSADFVTGPAYSEHLALLQRSKKQAATVVFDEDPILQSLFEEQTAALDQRISELQTGQPLTCVEQVDDLSLAARLRDRISLDGAAAEADREGDIAIQRKNILEQWMLEPPSVIKLRASKFAKIWATDGDVSLHQMNLFLGLPVVVLGVPPHAVAADGTYRAPWYFFRHDARHSADYIEAYWKGKNSEKLSMDPILARYLALVEPYLSVHRQYRANPKLLHAIEVVYFMIHEAPAQTKVTAVGFKKYLEQFEHHPTLTDRKSVV